VNFVLSRTTHPLPGPCFPSHQRERERGRESQESGKKKKKKKKKGVGVFKKAHGETTKLAK
jgi:hypothetical protein